MKKQLILAFSAVTAVFALPACTTVEQEPAPRTHTSTTTETESVVRRPVHSTVESTSVRSY